MKSRQQVSGGELKRRKKLNSETLLASSVSVNLLTTLQNSWADYAKAASKGCKSTAQIQTR
jgi:hypothetical protein